MTEQILILNYWLSVGTLFLEIVCIFSLALYLYLKYDRDGAMNLIKPILGLSKKFWDTLEKVILIKVFILSLFSSALTLYYSEVLGVIPCALCWFERIFMYGILLISGIALFSRNNLEIKTILKYINVFAILGALTSLYHHVLQMSASATSHLPCPASGGDCAKRIIFEFGHITFPWMAFIMFVLFIIMILIVKEIGKKE